MTRTRLALLVLLACASAWAPARAEEGVLSGTLKSIRDRGAIRMGVRASAIPFSFTNKGGQPIGFSVDLCHEIAEDVAAALNTTLLEPDAPAWQTGIRLAYVPITPDARIPKVVAGDIDLECGSTTANAERGRAVAFSPVFFLAGTKLLVPAASGIASYRDLANEAVAVSTGTTNADVLHALAKRGPAFTVLETADLPAAYDALAQGRAAAMASDDVLLAGLLATHPGETRFRIVGDYLSFEPYAIAYRRNDPDFAALVTASFQRLAQAGTLRILYRRWFTERLPTGETMDLPMSAQLTEMFRALGDPD